MIKFRVTLAQRPLNPFAQRFSIPTKIWEFEAESESQVREFYKQAVDDDYPYVRGFALERIEIMTNTS